MQLTDEDDIAISEMENFFRLQRTRNTTVRIDFIFEQNVMHIDEEEKEEEKEEKEEEFVENLYQNLD